MSVVKIPEGYKQTEVGVIPEDWKTTTIGSVTSWLSGGTPSRSNSDFWNGSIPWISGSTLKTLEIYTSDQFLTAQGVESGSKMAPLDSTLLLVRGSALHKFIRAGLVVAPVCFNQDVKALIPNGSINPKYLTIYILAMESELLNLVSSAGNSAGVLDTELVQSFKLLLPPKKEQTAIATALSDVDNLIQSLKKLIAKKEAIKTGTMQQLLTGKTRLPEFATRDDGSIKGFKQTELGRIPEDWGIRTVFELAERNSSNFNDGDWVESEHIINNGIRLLQTGNIGIGYFVDKGNKKYISEHSFIQLNCKLLEAGDLLICRLAEPAGRACIFKGVEEDKAITSVDVTIFRPPADSVNREFYLQVFSSSDWFNSINEQVGGTTHKRISRSALGSIYVPYPTYQEQTAIATILSDMDTEIQALQQRLEKTRDIKQGMMQQLLTGKVRLAH